MYNTYRQLHQNLHLNPSSTSFIRQSSLNRFRTTILPVLNHQITPTNRLRNSFSSTSIKYFEDINLQCQNKQDKKLVYNNLKSTLKELEEKIKMTAKSLKMQNKQKKKMQFKQINSRQTIRQNQKQSQTDFYLQKHRQTMSTQITTIYTPQTKISQFIASEPKPANAHPFFTNPYDSKKNNRYYISEALRASNQKNSLAMQHINASIKMIKSCAEFYNQNFNTKSMFKMQTLPKNNFKKTLVLDLDQTLIHCYENLQIQTDIKLSMNIQNVKVDVGVNIRPYAITFLKRMAKIFQLIIFTASHESYANAIIDQLDPSKELFAYRFYRQHCIVLPNQLHVKDLRYLNRDLKDVVLVDNAAYSYSFQLENGIPILPYYQGKDYELPVLQNYLEKISLVDDVREFNRQYFKLQKYKHFQNAEQLTQKLYSNAT